MRRTQVRRQPLELVQRGKPEPAPPAPVAAPRQPGSGRTRSHTQGGVTRATLSTWLSEHDPGYMALRRAARTALILPALFALGEKVFHDPQLATFAAFGTFSMLGLVDFPGPMRDRLKAQATLGIAGATLVCLGTLVSGNAWLSAVSMAVVAFVVLFAGVVSSVLARATTSLLLAFILPVSFSASDSVIPDRLAGWGLASVAALIAVRALWPSAAQSPLRAPAIAACQALALRLRADVTFVIGPSDEAAAIEHNQAIAQSQQAVEALHRGFLAAPFRPTGLSTPARTLVRLVDEIVWLNTIIEAQPAAEKKSIDVPTCAVQAAVADVLDRGAELLSIPSTGPEPLRAALHAAGKALSAMEQSVTEELPSRRLQLGLDPVADDRQIDAFIDSLEASFRSQELAFAASQIGRNVDLTVAAEQRGWLEVLLGHQPEGEAGPLRAARERALAHLRANSVWLHNSLRGAIGLGLAVLIANRIGVQHSFWVAFGTLSVLRSNALSTGQFVARAVLGTIAGFAIGGALLAVIGTNTTVLWILLPLAIFLGGVAPTAISFAVGQAAFTITLVILFNIIQPAGWRLGLIRVEDVSLGCGVSLAVALLFWPRGANATLRKALAEAYADSAAYLDQVVEFGSLCCTVGTAGASAPTGAALQAAAASRRLDDALRTYFAERGRKPAPLPEILSLVTGVAALRLTADAVLELWQGAGDPGEGDRTSARRELVELAGLVRRWYDGLATRLIDEDAPSAPVSLDRQSDRRFVEALHRDLLNTEGRASATAVRLIWTRDHLRAVVHLQSRIQEPLEALVATVGRTRAPLPIEANELR